MGILAGRFDEELKTAMKAGDKVCLSVVRMVKAALKNAEIAGGRPLADAEIIDLLMTLCKQRRESIVQFEKGGRNDLADQEGQELQVLLSFLPEQMSVEEVEEKVREAIRETSATGPRDMGNVMKAVKPMVAGRAEGKLVSEVVKRLLG